MTSSFAIDALTYDLYLILVVMLLVIAFWDLIIGVVNDAANFLNSAMGSKVGSMWLILGVAALGVIGGATFSQGMMTIARSGVFNPAAFTFADVMVIFLAVMITDLILLDLYNLIGFPTSTTVSIIFELFGAAVGVAVFKISMSDGGWETLYSYINTAGVIRIIIGIFLSIIIAFIGALIIQKITRLIFSFNYAKRFKYLGSLYGGIAVAAIMHFMIVKGATGSTFISAENAYFLIANSTNILFINIAVWTVLFQILRWLFKVDILKIVVLMGTFSLAWAFASNDLVNFIGVPIAGLMAFQEWAREGLQSPDAFSVGFLGGEIQVPSYMLLIAGVVMAFTLVFSKKAHHVLNTSVNLSRQSEGEERFASWVVSRLIVAFFVKLTYYAKKLIPPPVQRFIDRQFQPLPEDGTIPQNQKPAFDKLRAASNLLVAGIIISYATSQKLPLSTTFVTFMAAMGSSLADKAWGRESAVYRISGVLFVIAGWFFTAFAAFTGAFLMSMLMVKGGFPAIFVLFVIAIIILIRAQFVFVKKSKAEAKKQKEAEVQETSFTTQDVIERCNQKVIVAIGFVSKIYKDCFLAFETEDKQLLKQVIKESDEFTATVKQHKSGILKNVKKLNEDLIETGHHYVQVVDYLRETARSVRYFTKLAFEHYNNSHTPFTKAQCDQLNHLRLQLEKFFTHCKSVIKRGKFSELNKLIHERQAIVALINEIEKTQIMLIKNSDISTRNSILFFDVVTETNNVVLHLLSAMRALRKFVENSNLEIKTK